MKNIVKYRRILLHSWKILTEIYLHTYKIPRVYEKDKSLYSMWVC